MVAHTFNPRTREVETGKDMAGLREEYKAEEERTQCSLRQQSEDEVRGGSLRTGSSFWSEDSVDVKGLSSGWLHYFSDLSAFTP